MHRLLAVLLLGAALPSFADGGLQMGFKPDGSAFLNIPRDAIKGPQMPFADILCASGPMPSVCTLPSFFKVEFEAAKIRVLEVVPASKELSTVSLPERLDTTTRIPELYWKFNKRMFYASTAFDRNILDEILHGVCHLGIWVAEWDRVFDERVIDGAVNLTGNVTYSIGRSFRGLQTGLLRQYIMFIALSVVTLFILLFIFFPTA